MNKLFTKIVGVALGLTMAIGVGLTVASNSEAVPVHAAGGTFTKITSTSDLTSGAKYLIVSESDNLAFDGSLDTIDAVSNTKSVTISSNSIITTSDFYFTITSKTGGYSIKGSGGKYIGSTSSNANELKSGTSDSYTNTITWDSTNSCFIIRGTNSYLVYNSTSGQTRFRFFKPGTCGNGAGTGAYHKISLFKEQSVTNYTVTFAVNTPGYGTVSRSSITGVPNGTSISTSNNTVTINGTTVTATPTANTDQYTYAFTGWSNNTGTVTAARTITANFSRTTNTFTVSDSGILHGSLDSTATIEYGGELDVNIVPDSGYSVPTSVSVTMGGNDISGDIEYENGYLYYQPVTGDIVVTASCPASGNTYSISTSVTNGTYSGDTSITDNGGTASVTIAPTGDYKLPASVSVSGASHTYNQNTGVISLSNASGNVTISAAMVALTGYSITVNETNGSHTGASTIKESRTASLTFTPASGYANPSSVTVSGATSSWTRGTGVLSLSNPTGNVIVTYVAVGNELDSIELSANSGSYTLGDPLDVTVTAKYTLNEDADVTDSANLSVSGYNPYTEGSHSVTFSYTEGGITKTASYTATVTAVVPSSGGIAKVTKTSDLTIGSTVYLVCEGRSKQLSGISTTSTKYGEAADYTTTPANTYPLTVCAGNGGTGYAFKNSSNNYLYWTSGNSLNQSSTLSNNTSWTVSFDASGNATILNVDDSSREIMWNYSSPRFACYSGQTPNYNNTSGYNMVQIYKNYPAVVKSLKWITAEVKSGTYYQGSDVTASDFTVTAHYDDGTTSTPTSDITVTNATLTVIGSNTVTLTYGGKSCNVTVTAVELTSEYTGLSWAQGEYTIIDGQNIDFSKFGTVTAEYDDGETSAAKAISSCTVATYTKSGDVYTKVADLDDGDTITSSSHGKYLGVTYTETNTYTAYSSAPIYVVEAIEDVYAQVKTTTWAKVTSLNAGDKVTFVNENSAKVASGFDSNLITVSSYDSSVSTNFYFEVGKVGNYYTFHNANGYLGNHSTGTSGNNYAYLDAEIDEENNMNYFTVSFDEGNVVITSVYDSARKLQFNSTRFCFYGSNQSVVQLYKGTDGYTPSGESFANTNANVQKAVLEYAEHFNDTMNCVSSGTTADVESKWSSLSSDFSTAMSGFIGDDLAHFKALFANAYSVEGGDTLQDMLARYDYIVAKYKLSDDFLHDDAGRGAVQYARVTPLNIVLNNGNTIAIIVVISMISVTAIGGYFFLRKRKED